MRGITQGRSEHKIIKEKRGPERGPKDSNSGIKHNLTPDQFHQIIRISSGLCLPSCALILLGFPMRRNGHKSSSAASMACTGRQCSGEGVCLNKNSLKLVSTCQVFKSRIHHRETYTNAPADFYSRTQSLLSFEVNNKTATVLKFQPCSRLCS